MKVFFLSNTEMIMKFVTNLEYGFIPNETFNTDGHQTEFVMTRALHTNH